MPCAVRQNRVERGDVNSGVRSDGVGAGEPGQRALDMLRIDNPTLDFVGLAKSMGVPGRAVANVDDFVKALAEAVAEPGPRLIEVQM